MFVSKNRKHVNFNGFPMTGELFIRAFKEVSLMKKMMNMVGRFIG